MTPDEQDRWDEAQVDALLHAAEQDCEPVDQAFLKQLRAGSTRVFLEAPPALAPTKVTRATSRKAIPVSAFAAVLAIAAIIIAAVIFAPATPPTLADVLENTAESSVLHLNAHSGDVWVRNNELRLIGLQGKSEIVHDDRAWLVDEANNQVTPRKAEYFTGKNGKLNFLKLIGVDLSPNSALLRQWPKEQLNQGGKTFNVYRIQFPGPQKDEETFVVAFADPETGLLDRLSAIVSPRGAGMFGKGLRESGYVQVVARDIAVDEDKFVVADTLTEDGRIGKVTEAQGLVSVKPALARRWTPLCNGVILKPGDWVRTDIRGANAIEIRLVPQTKLVLGPGSLVELVKFDRIRLHAGDISITTSDNREVTLLAPGNKEVAIADAGMYRVKADALVKLDQQPPWLQSFSGATNNESIGSLVALVDGRNVPLSVGYHKVTVDIRDQIARTVIEESFVNSTATNLEGVFYFPLPQDASIAGFGMWINNELVEADIVEKQRAREIYETILREKRDPGLLEWSGGNLFKARVFPILAHSEKRIKITYTQVLPLRGNRYRYNYALQSDLLKQHPLRELSIDVKVNSVLPLKQVICSTHSTRDKLAAHAAQVEFAAQEYTPTRDFEVEIEVERPPGDVTLIPHQRGEDGYFMMLLMPPGESGPWQREILPDGDPIELLILADTSGSMDLGARENQEQLIASLLGALTEKDTFNLATCDVECRWAFGGSVSADAANGEQALKTLQARRSLGWTDLDKTFSEALKRTGNKTHVIYVGDGIITTGDGDPQSFSKRLAQLYQGNIDQGRAGTFHAVSVSSTFESSVLKSIAALGGGSVRNIRGQESPQLVARDLLAEIANPGLRNVSVQFRGLRTARVYPERLPNLSRGSQQIVLGRYLPEGKEQMGEIVVSGMQGSNPVKFSSPVSLANAEQGNSFIPRLWARMHLDSLLEQGTSEAIKDEIITLSEEFHIITPYTSLLVLETDADRERFKVKRRFQMRDGERFFAEGRDNAQFELAQQQMRSAASYRLGLRRMVLQQLGGLGRYPQLFQQNINDLGLLGRPMRFASDSAIRPASGMPWGGGGGFGGRAGGESWFAMGEPSDRLESDSDGSSIYDSELKGVDKSISSPLGDEMDFPQFPGGGDNRNGVWDGDSLLQLANGPMLGRAMSKRESRLNGPAMWLSRDDVASPNFFFESLSGRLIDYRVNKPYYYQPQQDYVAWFNELFPQIPPATKPLPPPADSKWTAEARALAESLLRVSELKQLDGGILVERRTDQFDTRLDLHHARGDTIEVYSPKTWLTRSESANAQTQIQWVRGEERGIYSRAFKMGRVRKATPDDLEPPLGLPDSSLVSIEQSYASYTAEIRPQEAGRALLVLKHERAPDHEIRWLIDTERKVLLKSEFVHENKVTSTTTFSDFVEVAGMWWAQTVETVDGDGKRVSLTTQKITARSQAEVEQRIEQELSERPQVLFVHEPLPTVLEARRHIAENVAKFDDHIALMMHYATTQQWERVQSHFDAAVSLAEMKEGVQYLTNAVLNIRRRHAELQQRLMQLAQQLASAAEGSRHADEMYLGEYIFGHASTVMSAGEMQKLLDVLRPIYERQPAYAQPMKIWRQRLLSYLQQTSPGQAIELLKQLAVDYPLDYSLQQQYAQALANQEDFDAAFAWLDQIIRPEIKWLPNEVEYLRSTYVQLLEQQGRYSDMADYLARAIESNPQGRELYEQYLFALLNSGKEETVVGLISEWAKQGMQPGKLEPHVSAKLWAASNFMIGRTSRYYSNYLDPRWHSLLNELVRFFAGDAEDGNLADTIMTQSQFNNTDLARRLRAEVAQQLLTQINELDTRKIAQFTAWTVGYFSTLKREDWQKIAGEMEARWEKTEQQEDRDRLAGAITQILSNKVSPSEVLRFLRRQVETGADEYKPAYRQQLFNTLLAQPWTQEIENEVIGLLEQMDVGNSPGVQLFQRIARLHTITDAMLRARYDAALKTLEHPEKLTRRELQAKQSEFTKQARIGLSDRYRQELEKHEAVIRTWINAERLYLDVLTERNLDEVVDECWKVVDTSSQVAKAPPPEQLTPEEVALRELDNMLSNRYLTTLMNLAARRTSKPDLAARVLKYFDERIQAQPDTPAWKALKFEMLVALDRPQDLRTELEKWIRADKEVSLWRAPLAYLLAELGDLPAAIKLFESLLEEGSLTSDDQRTLANWYLAVGNRDAHEQALRAVFATLEEYAMSYWLQQRLQPWQYGNAPLPSELDPDVMRMFAALFQKSNTPANYIYQLVEFYRATHDFRLIGVMTDAVIGHTAGKIYPFLQSMKPVFDEIRDEATVDSIVARANELRSKAMTAVDQRAIDLVQAMAQRRAAELQNQPGPHGEAALAALKRAYDRGEWAAGEPALMAQLLRALGNIAYQPMAEEQVKELRGLLSLSEKGTLDRLQIATALANIQWGYVRQDEAIDLLGSELNLYRETHPGGLSVEARDAFTTLVSFYEQRGRYARAEELVRAEQLHPLNQQQANWLVERLYDVFIGSIGNDGTTSLGSGSAQYQAVQQQLRETLKSAHNNHRHALISRLCNVFQTAHGKQIPNVAPDAHAFAFAELPAYLTELQSNYSNIVTQVAAMLQQVAGTRDALAFVIERIEHEPLWLRYQNQNAWDQHVYQIGAWREELKAELGDLEPRLLAVVKAELHRDLESMRQGNRMIYHRAYQYFWAEKREDFLQVAEDVLKEHPNSGALMTYIAEYLYSGLEKYPRAIEVLLAAHREKLLDDAGEITLVNFLHMQNRHGESIAVLEPLVAEHPETAQYRTLLMHAHFRTDRKADLLALLADTDKFLRAENRWNESVLAALAYSTLENQLYEQSAEYYQELITLYQRSRPDPGAGDGTLSQYYSYMAEAYAGLGNTVAAVDAASGAIVAWGPQLSQREAALASLRSVLTKSPNLDEYVKHLNDEVEKSGLDRPVVRRALGEVFISRQQWQKAIEHLEIATQLQSNDLATHKLLVQCYDALQDKAHAIEELFKAIESAPRDVELYKTLAERFMEPTDKERAVTSYVEMLPTEAESHQMLAEVRQTQERWPEAIAQWQQVARIRALEPNGLLQLARAQIHERQWNDAQNTLHKLSRKSWPSRFGSVESQVADLQRQLDEAKK